MRRVLQVILGLTVAVAGFALQPVPRAEASGHQGAISWTVDHDAKTITVRAKLQVYPACSEDFHSCTVSQLVAERVRIEILRVWNAGYTYRCYELAFDVDVTLGTSRFAIDDDRIGVGIDESPVPIRSWVMASGLSNPFRSDAWQSNDPADRINPDNAWLLPSTWRRVGTHEDRRDTTYAHEFGHILGLDDTYRDTAGGSEPIPGAPVDLMAQAGNPTIAQETIDRLVERNRDRLFDAEGNRVELEDLRCEYRIVAETVQATTQPGLNPFALEARFEVFVEPEDDEATSYRGTGTVSINQAGGAVPRGACPPAEHVKNVDAVVRVEDDRMLLEFAFGSIPARLECADLVPWSYVMPVVGGYTVVNRAAWVLAIPASGGTAQEGYTFDGATLDHDCGPNAFQPTSHHGDFTICTWHVEVSGG
jgi:hypothetical protein